MRHGPAGYWWAAAPKSEWPEDDETREQIEQQYEGEFGDRRQELVFIGQGLSEEQMNQQFDAALLTDDEQAAGPTSWHGFSDPFPSWDTDEVEEQVSSGTEPGILADIYQPSVNLAVWHAGMDETLEQQARAICEAHHGWKLALSGSASELGDNLADNWQLSTKPAELIDRIRLCLNLFEDLMEPAAIGMRLEVTQRATCPRFHVDKLATRMITTFCGPTTEWLPNHAANRELLGLAGMHAPDHESGLIMDADAIEHLAIGDVALMKGEGWIGNEGHGFVHRSPDVAANEQRLVLTLDQFA